MIDSNITDCLKKAQLALSANHGCLTTDRPDLVSIDPDLFWTIDHSIEIGAIDKVLLSIDNDPGCVDRSIDPST